MVNFRGKVSRSSFRISSKGQVTIFIIIGIVMLFLFAGILLLTRTTTTDSLEAELEPAIAQVPREFAPIVSYTESCLNEISKQGLRLVGHQGGYITPDLVGRYSLTQPTESDGLDLQPTKVPYWHYNAQPNAIDEISFASLQPALTTTRDPELSIESQLSRFIEERIDSCLDSYQTFNNQGFVINYDLDGREVTVQAGENSVNVLLDMPLQAERGDAETDVDKFFVRIPLRLRKYYELADYVVKNQQNYSYLEKQALDLIQVYSSPDVNKLPPTSDLTFDYFPQTFWAVPEVKLKLQQMLSSYVPLLQSENTANSYRHQYPVSDLSGLYQETYDTMILPFDDKDPATASGVDIQFDYLDWPLYLRVNTDGNTIKPLSSNVQGPLGLFNFGFQQYDTRYDVSYPVLVTITDRNAFDGEGYSFSFAMESNVRNNKPAENNQLVLREPSPLSQTSLCNDEQQTSEIIHSLILDGDSNEPLRDVGIAFQIPGQTTCQKGLTNLAGKHQDSYPEVYGGVISYLKEGYLPTYYAVDTYTENEPVNFVGYSIAGLQSTPEISALTPAVELFPQKTVRISAKKKDLSKCITPLECTHVFAGVSKITCNPGPQQCFFSSGGQANVGLASVASNIASSNSQAVATYYGNNSMSFQHDYYFQNTIKDLEDDEELIILLERVSGFTNDPNLFYEPFQTAVTISGDQQQLPEVVLYPGKYKVQMTLISDRTRIIPKEQRCSTYTILLWDQEECYDFDEVQMDSFVESIVDWNEPEFYLEITPEQLYSSEEIVFYSLGQNVQDVPAKIKTKVRTQGILPGVGALSYAAYGLYGAVSGVIAEESGVNRQEVEVNGFIVEELNLIGDTTEIAQRPAIRERLQPQFR